MKRKIMKCALALGLCVFTLSTAPLAAAPRDDLNAVIADHWRWYLSQNPVQATALGVRDYDDQIGDISLEAADRTAATAQGFIARLEAIGDGALDGQARTNKNILLRVLRETVENNLFGQRMMLFSTYSGWHQSFASMANGLPFYNRADYVSYLTRLGGYPKLNGDALAITRRAISEGYVQPCVVLDGFEKTISGAVDEKPETGRFFEPFTRAKPVDISDGDWAAMKARALTIIRDTVTPEYAKFLDVYTREYRPKCRTSIGASALPDGPAYYAFRARVHTTTTLTPDQIHTIGLNEVARIRAEMVAVAKAAGYPTREAFIAKLRTEPAYYAATPEALMMAAARTAKVIDGKMPQYFGRLPRLPYGIREIPKETAETTTTAYYNPGSPESGIAGNYYVNTSKLPQRPLWELPALTAHEAVPGHHHQIALQQELTLPDFRKSAVGFSAFVEGWGLYAEHLGIEMGLYDTPEKNMGRLSYEMWRACRLVVDTGMHAKGWSKARAIAFMRDNSALSDANIEAEVNRYISWPGQALAYKIGELKIRELRARAEKTLGAKFDLRAFHDVVLGQGPVPLDMLELQVDEWIAQRAKR
jgi:uncharacterized protein (DUF885 family)